MSRRLPRSVWSPRLLDGLSAALGLVAVAAFAWRGTPDVSPRAVPVPSAGVGDAALTPDADSLSARIVATNIFSATRRTPRARFVVPGQIASEATGLPDAYMPAVTATSDDGLRVVGIVSVNGVRRALVDTGVNDSTTRLVDVGARIAGYRITRIGADVVEFSSASGTRIVRLSRRSSSDSSESLP